jgi:hypothetical protein
MHLREKEKGLFVEHLRKLKEILSMFKSYQNVDNLTLGSEGTYFNFCGDFSKSLQKRWEAL